jgi:hypothetical protein
MSYRVRKDVPRGLSRLRGAVGGVRWGEGPVAAIDAILRTRQHEGSHEARGRRPEATAVFWNKPCRGVVSEKRMTIERSAGRWEGAASVAEPVSRDGEVAVEVRTLRAVRSSDAHSNPMRGGSVAMAVTGRSGWALKGADSIRTSRVLCATGSAHARSGGISGGEKRCRRRVARTFEPSRRSRY